MPDPSELHQSHLHLRAWVLRLGAWSVLIPKRSVLLVLILLLLLSLLLAISLMFGAVDLSLSELFAIVLGNGEATSAMIVETVRRPRALCAICAGAALALSGSLLQGITRNRLASPSILGVNDGAVFAVMMMVFFSATPVLGEWWISCLGAMLAFCVLLLLSNNVGHHGHRILVIGIGVSHIFRAINELVLSRGHIQHATAVYIWSVGSFVGRDVDAVWPCCFGLLVCIPWALLLKRHIDCFSLNEGMAQGLGVSVASVKIQALLLAVIAAGLGLSIGGPLVFVAMVAPIIVSKLLASAQLALGSSMLFGGILCLSGDLIGRLLLAPIELPVGVVCRIFGGMCLLILLLLPTRQGHAS